MKELIRGLNEKIRRIKDFPKKGIVFWDMTTLFSDKDAFASVIDEFFKKYRKKKIDYIASIESRGFVLGAPLAYRLKTGFHMIRKKGKLPSATQKADYEKEYGLDTIELHTDAIHRGDKVLIVDDLCATGNTVLAACNLIEGMGGVIVGCAFIVELDGLGAEDKLKKYDRFSLIKARETE